MTTYHWVRRTTVLLVTALAVPLTAGIALAGGPTTPQNVPVVLPPPGGRPVPVVTGLTVHDRAAFVSVPARSIRSVTATCAAGEERISGGFAVTTDAYRDTLAPTTPYDRYPVVANYPTGVAAWTVAVLNRTGGSAFLAAHVECTPDLVGAHVATGAPGAADPTVTTATCPAGTVVTGGGWAVPNVHRLNQVVSIWASGAVRNQAGEGWQLQTAIPPGSRASTRQNGVFGYAVCTSSWLHPAQGRATMIDIPNGGTVPTSGYGRAGCTGLDSLTGAGFALPRRDGSVVVTSFYPDYSAATATWGLTAYGLPWVTGVGGGQAALLPVCDFGAPF